MDQPLEMTAQHTRTRTIRSRRRGFGSKVVGLCLGAVTVLSLMLAAPAYAGDAWRADYVCRGYHLIHNFKVVDKTHNPGVVDGHERVYAHARKLCVVNLGSARTIGKLADRGLTAFVNGWNVKENYDRVRYYVSIKFTVRQRASTVDVQAYVAYNHANSDEVATSDHPFTF